ncbi:MAG TPA: hypothetical protein PLQ35_07965, partial [bacterium]|nr:hypothetical protein [bacterium]
MRRCEKSRLGAIWGDRDIWADGRKITNRIEWNTFSPGYFLVTSGIPEQNCYVHKSSVFNPRREGIE